MRSKNKPTGQETPSFIEAARRAQIVAKAIETIAELGFAQASLAQIAQRSEVSKGVILYYFTSKEELLRQVVAEIFSQATQTISPQIAAQPSARLRLQVYVRSAIEYIGAHRAQMKALTDILSNHRGGYAQPFFGQANQEAILVDLETLLRAGQAQGDFRAFDPKVMAVTIRRAIDVVPSLLVANPNLDAHAYADELATLFDRATCKDEE